MLGTLISFSNRIHDVDLSVDLFTSQIHVAACNALIALKNEGSKVDLIMVAQMIKALGLEKHCPPDQLAALSSRVGTSAHLEDHIAILSSLAQRRALRKTGANAMQDAIDETKPVIDALNDLADTVSKMSDKTVSASELLSINEVFAEQDRDFQAAKTSGGVVGIPTGLTKLDRLAGGLRNGELSIVAARPGMGKTALACSIALNAAKQKRKTVFITLEMEPRQLQSRIFSNALNIPFDDLNQSRLSTDHWRDMVIARLSELNGLPLKYVDKAGISIEEIRNRLRKTQRENGLDLVVIDYLQLITVKGKTTRSRNEEVGFISRSLKTLAKELKVPILCLAQLSRAVEQRGGDKMPQLSDLRDSGEIEQDADLIAFLTRPAYYGIIEDASGNSTEGLCLMNIAKHRNGETKIINLRSDLDFMRFSDWTVNINT